MLPCLAVVFSFSRPLTSVVQKAAPSGTTAFVRFASRNRPSGNSRFVIDRRVVEDNAFDGLDHGCDLIAFPGWFRVIDRLLRRFGRRNGCRHLGCGRCESRRWAECRRWSDRGGGFIDSWTRHGRDRASWLSLRLDLTCASARCANDHQRDDGAVRSEHGRIVRRPNASDKCPVAPNARYVRPVQGRYERRWAQRAAPAMKVETM